MEGVQNAYRPRNFLETTEISCAIMGLLLSTFLSFRAPGISFTISDFFLTLAILLRCIRTIPQSPIQSGTSLWMIGISMIIGGLLVGSIAHGNTQEGFVVVAQYFFSLVLLPLVILGRPHEEAVLLAKIGIYSIALNCLIGLIAYTVGYSGQDDRQFVLVSGSGRITGLVDNPNSLAGLIVLWFPVLWYLGLTREFRPVVFVSLFTLTFVALIFTSSNSSLAGAIICAVIFLLLLGKLRFILIWSVMAAFVIAIILRWGETILPATFVRRVLSPILEGDLENAGTFEDRAGLMIEAWRFLPDYMLIGMGGGQYREISPHNISVHNLYLLLANEGGLVALMGLFLVFFAAFFAAVVAKPETPHRRLARATVITITLTFAALAMNYTHVYQRAILLPWIVSIGLLSTYRRTNRQ